LGQRKLEGCCELSDFVDIHFPIGARSGLAWYRILSRHAPRDCVFAGQLARSLLALPDRR
jgi:hypothetical protein